MTALRIIKLDYVNSPLASVDFFVVCLKDASFRLTEIVYIIANYGK